MEESRKLTEQMRTPVKLTEEEVKAASQGKSQEVMEKKAREHKKKTS